MMENILFSMRWIMTWRMTCKCAFTDPQRCDAIKQTIVWTWIKYKSSLQVCCMPGFKSYIFWKTPSNLKLQIQSYSHFSEMIKTINYIPKKLKTNIGYIYLKINNSEFRLILFDKISIFILLTSELTRLSTIRISTEPRYRPHTS